MFRARFSSFLVLILVLSIAGLAFATGVEPQDPKKRTSLGKYATSIEAYNQWKAAPDKIFIIDCRTPQEYVYVGHAPMAVNIPSLVWTGKFDAEKKDVVLEKNPEFVSMVKNLYKPGDQIMIMCRSGHRSAACAEELIKAGFTNVFNITDGFEGDKLNDKSSPNHGKRVVNGWKNSGAPWTYDLDLKLMPALIQK